MRCEAQWIIDLPGDVLPMQCIHEANHDGEHFADEVVKVTW